MVSPIKSYTQAFTFENIWFLGHCLTLLSAILYGIGFFTSKFFYKSIFVGVLISFGIQLYQKYLAAVVSKKQGTKKKSLRNIFVDVNFHYFFIAFVWFLTSSSMKILAIPPFLIFSSFHILSYSHKLNDNTNNQITSIVPQPVLVALMNLEIILRNHRDKLVSLSSVCEVSLFVYLIINTLLFSKTSLIQLICYLIFIKIRLVGDAGVANSANGEKNNNSQLLVKNFKLLDQRITIFLQTKLPQNANTKKISDIYQNQFKGIIVKKFVEFKIPFIQSTTSESTKKNK